MASKPTGVVGTDSLDYAAFPGRGFPPTCVILPTAWVVSSAGRASPLQGECRGFDPLTTHQLNQALTYQIGAKVFSSVRPLYIRWHEEALHMGWSERITFDPAVMGGKPCIRGIRVTVGMLVSLIAAGHSQDEILRSYPYLEPADIHAALAYAAWRSQERELPLATA